MDIKTAELIMAMTEYDKGDVERIQHFMKVHSYAAIIGRMEGLDEETLVILETAAILHDIGIHKCEEKYGSEAGNLQEQEGPPEAEALLDRIGGYTKEQIERVKFLIGHHHTYTNIDSLDYQILIEADFLVNLYENADMFMPAASARDKIFRTKTGLELLELTFFTKYLSPKK